MDTQLHSIITFDVKNADTTITNFQNLEEIYIKEEPVDENSEGLYENVLQSVKKECIADNGEQINNKIQTTENINSTNCQNFEEIYIKEETLETTFEDCEVYEVQSVKKEEYTTDIVPINNDIEKTEHTKSNNFCCTKCNKSFTQKTRLNRHLKRHEENKKFDCSICPPDSDIKSRTRRHIHCPTCHKLITRKCNLNDHMKTHTGIKDHQCTVCYKLFRLTSSLNNHMKNHSETRAYKCPTCNKSFTKTYHFKEHLAIHTGIKDYKCEICNKQFTQSRNLYRHMKIHSGTKEFQCSMCEKSFTRKLNLNKHMETHNHDMNST